MNYFFKSHHARTSAASTLESSASAPTFGFNFMNNSEGASAAVAELSKAFDRAIEDIELEGNTTEDLEFKLGRLETEASKYDCSQLSKEDMRVNWECSASGKQVIAIASECAASAYDPKKTLSVGSLRFEKHQYVPSSLGGSQKQMTFVTVTEPVPETCEKKNEFLPLLVVAIRGTKAKVDWMVNANGQPRSIVDFVDTESLGFRGTEGLEAHSGFLGNAKALQPYITQRIKGAMATGAQHVLFTGHSAGGAIATLLYLKYHSDKSTGYKSCLFSCITFGSPPTVRPYVTTQLLSGPRVGLLLNFVNELDMIPRLDKPYILSLVNLYLSTYRKPPLHEADDPAEEAILDRKSTKARGSDGNQSGTEKTWEIPDILYSHVGELVVLREQECEHNSGLADEEDGVDSLELKAFVLEGQAFQKLLFVGVSLHKMNVYRNRIARLTGA